MSKGQPNYSGRTFAATLLLMALAALATFIVLWYQLALLAEQLNPILYQLYMYLTISFGFGLSFSVVTIVWAVGVLARRSGRVSRYDHQVKSGQVP